MKKKELWVYMIILIMAGLISSCQISDQELGEDLLPPGDNVILYHDTIFDIDAYPITGKPMMTSETSNSNATGSCFWESYRIPLWGVQKPTVVTQFNTNHPS